MAARANWHTATVLVDRDDPFADAPAEVQTVGVPIDLDGPRAELNQRLVELVAAEAELFNRGVTCEIRDRRDTCCSACPLMGAEESPGELCSVGFEQENVLTELAVISVGRGR